jgi:hypothetical protein
MLPVAEKSSETVHEYNILVRRFADTEDTSIAVSSTMTVSKLKALIKERLHVAEGMQKLLLEDTLLNKDSACLGNCGVGPGVNILVVKVENPYDVGKEIESKDANGRWMACQIKGENPDGTLVLTREDTVWSTVSKINTRPIYDFREGEPLEGKDAKGRWFPIIVKGINSDGTYACDVLKPDGSIQRQWEKTLRINMRSVEDFNELPDVLYHGRDCNGKAWPVKVTKKNSNGTYVCEVQDGHSTRWPEAHRCNLW